jgi:hypothetical protein
MLHLALFYKPIDLWLAFYITMDDVTVRPPVSLLKSSEELGTSREDVEKYVASKK